MISRSRFAISLAFVILLPLAVARAQKPSVSTVNVTPDERRVRVAPVGNVFDLRIEVVDEAGDTVFEGTQASDTALDWPMTDARGERVRPGVYTVTVSYTTGAGKARKRIEQVLVTEEVKGGEQKASASAPNPQPLVDGGGAANRIPKFTDGDTLTSSVITDAAGRIGVGIGAAAVSGPRLEVNGLTRLTPGGSGGYMQFGTPNTETGLTWSKGTTSRADIRFNGTRLTLAAGTGAGVPANSGIVIDTTGKVGIGILLPTLGRVDARGAANLPAIYGESPNRGVWGKSTGSSYGVYGESGNGIGIQGVSTANVGVVGATSAACCVVAGVYGYSTNGATTGVKGSGATGVHGVSFPNAGTGVLGESNAGPGVYGKSNATTTAGAGVVGHNNAGGWAMYAGSHAGQARAAGGWVKAMVIVNGDGTIFRCFNSQMPDGGASQPPSGTTGCGFTTTAPTAAAQYFVNFGFLVSDRFVSVTPGLSGTARAGASLRYPSSNSNEVSVFTFVADGGDPAIAQFTVIVY